MAIIEKVSNSILHFILTSGPTLLIISHKRLSQDQEKSSEFIVADHT